MAERANTAARRSRVPVHSHRKEDIQRESNAEGGRVPLLSTERRPLNDNEGRAQGAGIASQRHLHALSGDRGESEKYEWQNGRLSPQSPVHSPSYTISSDDENHRTHGYDNQVRWPGSNRSEHRRDGLHTLQTETSDSWRSEYSPHSRSHIHSPHGLPIPSKSKAHGQYAVSPTSGYGRLSPVPGFPSVDPPLERGKFFNSPSRLANSLSPSSNISPPPTEDRQRRRISKQPPSRTLIGSLPVPPATGPSIPLNPESTSSSRQRSLIPASLGAHSTGKWTSSVPSPPLSPLPNPGPSMSVGISTTQQPPITPGKAISRSRRNTLSKPDPVSSPATPYATAPEDSFLSQVASVPRMQGEDRSKDKRSQGHDHDVQDFSEKRRQISNPAPFRGEIPEYAGRAQPNAVTKRKRRESNAAGLVQQVHDAPSNASASARLRRASLSASRAAEAMVSADH